MSNNKLPLLRDQVTLPSNAAKVYLKTREKRIEFDRLQDEIWREFLARLDKPVRLISSRKHRIVEVLGTVRYLVDKKTGKISTRLRYLPGRTRESFLDVGINFLAYPPLILNKKIIEAFLCSWDKELFEVGPRFTSWSERDPDDDTGSEYVDASNFLATVVESFVKAINRSVYTKRLRYRVSEALALDPEVLDYTRRSRLVRHTYSVTDIQYNYVIDHLETYRQVNRDNPNLLWLVALAIREKIRLTKREPLKNIREAFQKEGVGPRGWRLLANHHQRDFVAAIEDTSRPWYYLTEYLQLHNTLDRNQPVPRKVAHLFAEPGWNLTPGTGVIYRGVSLPPSVLNTIVEEASTRQDIDSFLQTELGTVLSWLRDSGITLDANQSRQGWTWLFERAHAWFLEQAAKNQLTEVSWPCGLGEVEIKGYRFVPLNNAWAVRQEALRYRHCADNYIQHCLDGRYRLYAVFDKLNRHKATLGLQCSGNAWSVNQIKGFANQTVSEQLRSIADSISAGLEVVDEGREAREALRRRQEEQSAKQAAESSKADQEVGIRCSRWAARHGIGGWDDAKEAGK